MLRFSNGIINIMINIIINMLNQKDGVGDIKDIILLRALYL